MLSRKIGSLKVSSLIKNNMVNVKKPYKIEHLVNWYYGNFCVKHKNSSREHYEELKRIALSWNVPEMTHKEFVFRIRQELKCNPNKKKFDECSICKRFGIKLK